MKSPCIEQSVNGRNSASAHRLVRIMARTLTPQDAADSTVPRNMSAAHRGALLALGMVLIPAGAVIITIALALIGR